MGIRTLPTTAGERMYCPLPEMYSSSLTVVSYLSSDPQVGGTYKDLFSPSAISTSEVDGLFGLVSEFLINNYPEEKIAIDENATLSDKLEFLSNEGYFTAPLFALKENDISRYSEIQKNGYIEVGGLITTRGAQQTQAQMLATELNGEPFVFNILYQNTKSNPNDLSHPLYAVVDIDEVIEAADEIGLKESKELAKKDWHNLSNMSSECKKNCWLEAITQDARAFSLVPDDIRGNQWSIVTAIKKTNKPEVILSCAKEGEGLLKACTMLLNKSSISFDQLPNSLQMNEALRKYKSVSSVKPWSVPYGHERNDKNRNISLDR